MKSTMLAIVVTMVISALYSVQNIGDVTIRFLVFKWTFPQGVWDIILFCSGAVLMWLFCFFASRDRKNKHKREINELNEKLESLERDKKELLSSIVAAKAAQDSGNSVSVDVQPATLSTGEANDPEERV